jgi:hypothetical protein
MMKGWIIKCLLLTILIVAVALFLTYFTDADEINRKTAKLVFYEMVH